MMKVFSEMCFNQGLLSGRMSYGVFIKLYSCTDSFFIVLLFFLENE